MLTISSLPEEIGKLAGAIPAFPRVVSQLLDMVEDEGASLDRLVRMAKGDPVILAQILAMANRIRRIHAQPDISDPFLAASLIGMNQLRRVVVTVAMNRFSDSHANASFMRAHSQAVAIVAQELAFMVGVSPEGAYVLGILHDIGQLGFHVLDGELFNAIYAESARDGRLIEREREAFGLDHAELGGALAEYWMLPADYVASIRMHHDPLIANGRLQAVINIAESLARALDIPSSPKNRLTRINQPALQLLGIEWDSPAMADLYGRCRSRFRFAMA